MHVTYKGGMVAGFRKVLRDKVRSICQYYIEHTKVAWWQVFVWHTDTDRPYTNIPYEVARWQAFVRFMKTGMLPSTNDT